MTREDVVKYASGLYGPRWHRAFARDLGPHHPAGARETIDPRLVGRWASGDRPIPAWVVPALKHLLLKRYESLREGAIRSGLLREDEC